MRPPAQPARGDPDPVSPATRRLARVLAVALRRGGDCDAPSRAVAALHEAADSRMEILADARDVCRSLLRIAPGDARLRRADRLLAAALHPSAGHDLPAAGRPSRSPGSR
jgi:hypothetical protein